MLTLIPYPLPHSLLLLCYCYFFIVCLFVCFSYCCRLSLCVGSARVVNFRSSPVSLSLFLTTCGHFLIFLVSAVGFECPGILRLPLEENRAAALEIRGSHFSQRRRGFQQSSRRNPMAAPLWSEATVSDHRWHTEARSPFVPPCPLRAVPGACAQPLAMWLGVGDG